MEFKIKIGGKCFLIHCKYPIARDCFREFLAFDNEKAYEISINQKDILYEWQNFPEYDGNDHTKKQIGYEPWLERLAITRKILDYLLTESTILMHGVVVCDNKAGYMFTASSGIGKTTRAQLFLKNHSDGWILNGDKPLIRIEKDRVVACGTPWKGKENYGINAEIELKAVFLLERSDRITINPISMMEAFDFLLRQAFFSTSNYNVFRTIQLIKSLEGKVKLFHFCSPATSEAVEAAYIEANKE